MAILTALVTFHAGLAALMLLPMSVAADGRGERARARQMRTLAFALVLVMAFAQAQEWGVPLTGRLVLAVIGTIALVLPLRGVRA
jgi:hypothetical protein